MPRPREVRGSAPLSRQPLPATIVAFVARQPSLRPSPAPVPLDVVDPPRPQGGLRLLQRPLPRPEAGYPGLVPGTSCTRRSILGLPHSHRVGRRRPRPALGRHGGERLPLSYP